MSPFKTAASTPVVETEQALSEKGAFKNLVGSKRKHEEIYSSPPMPASNGNSDAVDPKKAVQSPGQLQTHERSKELRVSPPQRGHGNATKIAEYPDIVASMKSDGFAHYIGTNSDAERILFSMYGRNYFPYDKDRRVRDLKMMIDPKNYEEVHKRALQFVNLDGDKTLEYEVEYDCPNYPEVYTKDKLKWKSLTMNYGHGEGEMGWNAFEDFSSRWIQRVQLSGNCFLHAPVVLTSYLVTGSDDIEVIDISKYARASFDCEKVSRLIVVGDGGSSYAEFKKMVQQDVIDCGFERNLTDNIFACECNCPSALLHQLKTLGPALVQCFMVDEHFKNRTVTIAEDGTFELPYFAGRIDDPQKCDLHAMVLVGMRNVEGEWRVLMQNWWPRLQLVEVSAEYFISSQAELVFARKQPHRIPKEFERCDSAYAEADVPGRDSNELFCNEK